MDVAPHITVIIPCFNHGVFLPETIASVLAQDYKTFDILIVDDGSTDETTIKVLDSFEGQENMRVLRINNSGPAVARNKALIEARGTFIAFVDADDRLLPGFLSISAQALAAYPEVAVVYGNYRCFGERDEQKKQPQFDIIKMLISNHVTLCTLIRKQALDQTGGFDENLSRIGLEDWDIWLSLHEKGWRFRHLDKTLFEIRVTYSSRTFDVANKNLEKLKTYIYNKHAILLAENYSKLYHELKNVQRTSDFRLGHLLLKIPRMIKKGFFRKKCQG